MKVCFRDKRPNISIFSKIFGESATLSVFATTFKKIKIKISKAANFPS